MKSKYKSCHKQEYCGKEWHNIPYANIDDSINEISKYFKDSVYVPKHSNLWNSHQFQRFVEGEFCPYYCCKEMFAYLNYSRYLQHFRNVEEHKEAQDWSNSIRNLENTYATVCG